MSSNRIEFLYSLSMDMTFSEILQEFLTEKELTQTAFARMVNVKQSQVSEWLNGKAKPGYGILRRISLAFEITADYFLGITDNY